MASGTLTPFISVFVALMVVGAVGNAGLLATVSGVGVAAGGLPKSRPLLLPDLIVLHLCLACLVHALSGGVSLVATSSVCCQDLPDGFCAAVNFLSRFAATMGGWFTLLLSLYRSAKLRSLERPSLAVTRLEAAAWPRRACGLLWVALMSVFSPTLWFAMLMMPASTSGGLPLAPSYNASSAATGNASLALVGNASDGCGSGTCLCIADLSPFMLRYWQTVNYCTTWVPVALMLLSNAQMILQLWRHRRAVGGEADLGAAGTGRVRACVQAAKVVLVTVTLYVACKGALGVAINASISRGGVRLPPLVILVMFVAGPVFSALCPYVILTGDTRRRRSLLAMVGKRQRDGAAD